VRDQIHSYDVVAAFDAFARDPKPGEVYNLGGGRANSASVLECITMIEERLGRPVRTEYETQPRIGDHICYISDLSKLHKDYPGWRITRTLSDIIDELIAAEGEKS
jgi:CDP-paratose 2-epimerase